MVCNSRTKAVNGILEMTSVVQYVEWDTIGMDKRGTANMRLLLQDDAHRLCNVR